MNRVVSSRVAAPIVVLGLLACASAFSPSPVAGATNAVTAAAAPVLARQPPLPPKTPSPVEGFRQLLALPAVEREQALARKSERHRQYLEGQLRDFDRLSPTEREVRLRLMELRYHLPPLMRTAPSERGELLQAVPPTIRELVDERLRGWDALPLEQQQELLQTQNALAYVPTLAGSSAAQREAALTGMSAERRQQLEKELAHWRSLPSEQRDRVASLFAQLFDLNAQQRQDVLNRLPAAEREKTAPTIERLGGLSPDQRSRVLEAFARFSRMSHDEQDRLLLNAARWQAMTPEERRSWRLLISRLPPLPPNVRGGPPLPPIPSVPTPHASATNAQFAR